MNLHELTPYDHAILKYVRLDYFWSSLPFARLQTALDVGGHIGSWSAVCHEYAPHMAITAIEAHPDNYRQLVHHCPFATCIHGWCGYTDSNALCCREHLTGSHYVLRPGELPLPDSHTVPLPERYTLEDFGAIDLLKLDCEGSEFDILLNCERATLEQIQVIVGEYHLDRGDFADIAQRLIGCGFSLTMVPRGEAPHLGHFLAVKA